VILTDLPLRIDWEVSQFRRLFSHMIFTALCCYTTSGRRFALLQAISRIRSAHASRTLFRCPLYNSDPVTKDLGTNRMAISSAQGTLRATAQLGLYLYLGRQRHRSFSSTCFLFGGFLVVHGVFPFHTHCAEILCSHTSAISLRLAKCFACT
jgi:hypothetical protein